MSSKRKQQDTFLKKSWTLRLIPSNSQKTLVLRLKPMHFVILTLTIAALFIFIGKGYTKRLHTAEQQIVSLSEVNKQQKLYIDKLCAEKEQMAGLVEKQNLELGDKLRDIEQKSKEVSKIVGLKVKQPSPGTVSRRKSLKAHRGAFIYKKMENQINSLNKKISISEKQVKVIEKKAIAYHEEMERRAKIQNAIPSLYPSTGVITSPFGYRVHPIYGCVRFHSGIDIAADYGEPIYSGAAGLIVQCGYESGYGNCIKVDHGNGYATLYGHCGELIGKLGQYVNKGQLIARIGSTGSSTGPHLHYELLQNGTPIDPAPYMVSSAAKFKQKYDLAIK